MSLNTTDVLIVGAGPTGLLLAGDLAAAGVAVTVLEQRDHESNLTRAFAVHARTLELLDVRGVADELIATGRQAPLLRVLGRVTLDLSRLPSRFPYLLVTPQYQTERVLRERAEALGAQVVRGAEVVGLRQDPNGVQLDVRTADDTAQEWRAAYVVGADGIHSVVRKAVHLPFPGHAVVRSVMLADVRLTDTPREILTFSAGRDGFAFIAPFGDGWYRVIAWNRYRRLPDDVPVELAEVQAIMRKVLGTDYGIHDARWISRFHSDERQAPSYRVGRVFLAGDAAHVHSPAGGQGMNTGLQDAANLGWKLAAVITGRANDDLLDTYQAERHPVGRLVLRSSGSILRLARVRSSVLRAGLAELASVMMRIPPVASRIAGVISGVGIAYRAPHGAHRLVGKRAPDVPLAAGAGEPGRLYEALRHGRFVLVTSADTAEDDAPEWADVVTSATRTPPAGAAAMMLVRPDGYIAWAADKPDSTKQGALTYRSPTAPTVITAGTAER